MTSQAFPLVTPEEYLARERTALTNSEYIAGEILPRPDGSPNHNMLAGDTLLAIRKRLRAIALNEVYGNDQRLRSADLRIHEFGSETVGQSHCYWKR